MSRFSRVIHSVASGYALLAATAIYALASVPLALHYLPPERFGLWVLMSTIGGYLSLVDFGMSGSVARLLIDYKDKRDSGMYGSLIKTGELVLMIQGAIVFAAAYAIAPFLAGFLKTLPPELHGEFILLLRWQGVALGLSFASRIFGHILTAHQQIATTNYGYIAGIAANFALQWWFFERGHGVLSLTWATLVSVIFTALVLGLACWRSRLFPAGNAWGRASWNLFRELFSYGRDVFLVALGTQLIVASQVIIITRRLGLEAAASWGVGIRAFNLVSQAISRIMHYSTPAFSEMMVREERDRLRERFRDVVTLSASLAAFAAVTFAACNSLFVPLLSLEKIHWEPGYDILLGAWMILLTVQGCHSNLIIATKQIGFMRVIFFIEGLVFIFTAWVVSRWLGIEGIILSSLLCSFLFTTAYGFWRSSRYFNLPIKEIAGTWLKPMARVLLMFGPVGGAIWWLTGQLEIPLRLAIVAVVCGAAGGVVFLSQGLPPSLRQEVLQRSPGFMAAICRRLF